MKNWYHKVSNAFADQFVLLTLAWLGKEHTSEHDDLFVNVLHLADVHGVHLHQVLEHAIQRHFALHVKPEDHTEYVAILNQDVRIPEYHYDKNFNDYQFEGYFDRSYDSDYSPAKILEYALSACFEKIESFPPNFPTNAMIMQMLTWHKDDIWTASDQFLLSRLVSFEQVAKRIAHMAVVHNLQFLELMGKDADDNSTIFWCNIIYCYDDYLERIHDGLTGFLRVWPELCGGWIEQTWLLVFDEYVHKYISKTDNALEKERLVCAFYFDPHYESGPVLKPIQYVQSRIWQLYMRNKFKTCPVHCPVLFSTAQVRRFTDVRIIPNR